MLSKFEKREHFLRNDSLTITIKEKGAELSSLRVLSKEYLWQADNKFWGRHAPILFPIVGRLVDHQYNYDGRAYAMKQHGFARDSYFKVMEKTDDSIIFQLTETIKSKKIYPFDFVLEVTYKLSNKTVMTNYRVKNPSEKVDLYFSIGAHPAFNCPFEKNHQRNEYQLVFDAPLAPETESITEGLRSEQTLEVFEQRGKLLLYDAIFDNDALIFNPNPFNKVTFVHEPTQKGYLSLAFKNYPYLGIWSSNRDAPFVCIEPWYGITDHKNHNKELIKKEGIIKLLPKKTFSCEYSIEVLEH